jgi:RimJ/RimL family protein N-acetyltransferase
VPWREHAKWFLEHADSPDCLLYIAANSHGTPIGQIRCDIKGAKATISAGLAKEARGQGHGAALVLCGSERCFADSPVEQIRAYIKPQNPRSLRTFQAAGYTRTGNVKVQGQRVHRLVLHRGDSS